VGQEQTLELIIIIIYFFEVVSQPYLSRVYNTGLKRLVSNKRASLIWGADDEAKKPLTLTTAYWPPVASIRSWESGHLCQMWVDPGPIL